MRVGTAVVGGSERVVCVADGNEAVLLPRELGDLSAIVARGPAGREFLEQACASPSSERCDAREVRWGAPLRRFSRDVLCTGWNYWDHFYESAGKREGQDVPKPDAPTFFTKGPQVVIGPTDDIACDLKLSAKWDYEAEIVVVIGRSGRSIPPERAMEHVWGYCLANDVSQRDLQRRHGGQWLKGKSIDASMPLGPWITMAGDVRLDEVRLECELNGTLMQSAMGAEMAFSIPELIAELSYGMTLTAGDILLTGTPSGIGNARTPPVFLQPGDLVVVRGSGLGELRNRLVAADLASYHVPAA